MEFKTGGLETRGLIKYILLGVLLISLLFLEHPLLDSLSVYKAPLGGFILLYNLFIQLASLSIVSFILLWIHSKAVKTAPERHRLYYHIFFALLVLVALFLGFTWLMDTSLEMDIPYTWIFKKSGYDLLNLQYLGGWTITFTLLLALLFLLSDPRISHGVGRDGKKHLYIHSKVCGLLRLLAKIGEEDSRGNTLDHPVISMLGVEERWAGIGWPWRYWRYPDARFNDRVRLMPLGVVWICLKFIFGLIFASTLSHVFATRYLLIQGYMDKMDATWLDLLARYLNIFLFRLDPSVNIPPNFPIQEAFTFEFSRFLGLFIYWFIIIWIVKISLAIIADAIVLLRYLSNLSAIRVLKNILAIPTLFLILTIYNLPSQVFDRSTPYTFYTLILGFIVLSLATLWVKSGRFISIEGLKIPLPERLTHRMGRSLSLFILFILTLLLVFSPMITSIVFVQPYMQGRQYEYVWQPAIKPTIEFTRWAMELNFQRSDASLISTNSTDVLGLVRTFNQEAARLNMKPYVGVNWMSADLADTDIIFLNNREYWVTILNLVRPSYAGDVDIWRANHIILTHSERILAVDAATTDIVDAERLFNLSETPTIYYGEGGLWREVDEIYLDIRGFQEMHLPEYRGPPSYDGEPDYTYDGFWRMWRFGWMFRWDFALGDYGDIKALVTRDMTTRIGRILIPGITLDPDGYPVIDDKGNLYMLYWSWISWRPPHGYLDYPEYDIGYMLRRFAIVLVNVKNGEIDGYLMNDGGDYILNYYNRWYEGWDKPLPPWLVEQVRYSETLLQLQIDGYNFYFQDDFNKWQTNQFYEPTLGEYGELIEDVRYIILPVERENKWSAVRLVEWYQSPSRNLAGMYVAPSGDDAGELYFVDLSDQTVIGPWTALSTVNNDPDIKSQLTLRPNIIHGNILLYSIAGRLYYVIPWYAKQANLVLPAIMTIVDAYDQKTSFYTIQNPKNSTEVGEAAKYAFMKLEKRAAEETPQISLEERKSNVLSLLQGIEVLKPVEKPRANVEFLLGSGSYSSPDQWEATSSLVKSFTSNYASKTGRAYLWMEGNTMKLGVLINAEGIVELHYIAISLG